MSFRLSSLVTLVLGLTWACSPADDRSDEHGASSGGQSGVVDQTGGASGSDGGSSTGGIPGAGGESASGGAASGGAASGGADATGGASSGCTPNPSGGFVTMNDAILDETTCLYWHKATTTGNFEAVTQACDASTAGGFDDWRIPNVDELASIVKHCKDWNASSTWADVFEVSGDGYWTTTVADAGHYCAIGTSNRGDYYKYGPVGPQVGRCVRGTGAPPDVMDCTVATGCKNW